MRGGGMQMPFPKWVGCETVAVPALPALRERDNFVVICNFDAFQSTTNPL